MALTSQTLLDIGGGVVTVACYYDDETRRISLIAVNNTMIVGEQPSTLSVFLLGKQLDAPFGYTEYPFEGRAQPILPDPIPAPRLEVHYDG